MDFSRAIGISITSNIQVELGAGPAPGLGLHKPITILVAHLLLKGKT